MAKGAPRWFVRYAWAPIAVGAAAVLVQFGPPILRAEGLGFVFLAAIFVTTVLGGMGPGVVATVLSLPAAYVNYALQGRDFVDPHKVVGKVAFLILGLLIVFMVGLRRRARQALRASENRFRTAQELSLDAFTVLHAVRDKEGKVVDFEWVYANPTAERILGRSDLVGKRLLKELPGNRDNSDLFERYVAVTESGNPHDVELFYAKDGIAGWFRNMAVKLDDGVAVSFSDITQRKRTESALQELNATLEQRVGERTAELERSQEALRKSERLAAIGEVVAGLSHESRNALQRSLACVQMLDRRLKDQPQLQQFVAEIRAAHDELLQIYEGVGAYARPLALKVAPTDVAEVWREAWAKLIAQSGRTAVLREELDAVSSVCEADSFLLGQVFRNVFGNALDACADPVEVCVRLASETVEGKPGVAVRVRDNGPGLPPQVRSRIFEPFITTKVKGTGLGLAIVKRIAEAHGGSVEAAADGAPGLELVLRLPRLQP